MINFDLVGKLRLGQESDKFKPYQERKFDSGWANRTLMFNAICGDNRHMLTIQGGTYPDRNDYKIVTFSPSTTDVGGTRHSGERIEIPWKDRFVKNNIDKVAEFRKYIVDLEKYGRRRLLEQYTQKIHEGESVTDEELKSVGLTDESELADALEKSLALKKEFLTQWDQAEYMKKVLSSDKYKNELFYIRGTFTCQWSDSNQQWYTSMTPQKITLAKEDAEEYSKGSAVLYFGPGAVDDMSLEEKGKYFIKAYTMEYESTRKKNIPCEFQLVIPNKIPHVNGINDGKDELRAKNLVSKFIVEDDTVKELGVVFDILNGAQKVEITEDMLTDEERESIEIGLTTLEDIRRDLGNTVYGERIRENRYKKFSKGYGSGVRRDTAYTVGDLVIPPLADATSDENGSIFDEDNDDL